VFGMGMRLARPSASLSRREESWIGWAGCWAVSGGGQRLGWCVGGCDLRSDIMALTTITVLTLFCRFPGTLGLLEEGNAGSGVSGRTCLGRVKEDGNMVTLRDGG
jgi:hypothetical protein